MQETADDMAALNDLQQTNAPPPGQAASPEDPLLKKAIEVLEGRAVKKAA
jgi:hypothetical protein